MVASRVARVHYEIDDELHRECKSEAALSDVTLKEFVVEALREHVKRSKTQREQRDPS